jgi:hypothetical protein
MTGLNWKSDFAATVIHPFQKGNGRIHLNGTSGVKFKTRVEFFDPGFFVDAAPRNGCLSSAQLILDRGFSIVI